MLKYAIWDSVRITFVHCRLVANARSTVRHCDIVIFVSEKQIDLNTVNLKKLKVRDLKKILNDWEETCEGCIEKTDFIKRIEELKPKYFTSSSKTELWSIVFDFRQTIMLGWLKFLFLKSTEELFTAFRICIYPCLYTICA